MDKTRPVVLFCQVGMRGYLAYRILKQHGCTQVKNLTGGLKTYAWTTEKQANPDIFDCEDIKRRAKAEIEAEQGDRRHPADRLPNVHGHLGIHREEPIDGGYRRSGRLFG